MTRKKKSQEKPYPPVRGAGAPLLGYPPPTHGQMCVVELYGFVLYRHIAYSYYWGLNKLLNFE